MPVPRGREPELFDYELHYVLDGVPVRAKVDYVRFGAVRNKRGCPEAVGAEVKTRLIPAAASQVRIIIKFYWVPGKTICYCESCDPL